MKISELLVVYDWLNKRGVEPLHKKMEDCRRREQEFGNEE